MSTEAGAAAVAKRTALLTEPQMPLVGRILRTADFERVLKQAPRSRSAHFAVHHVAAGPSLPKKPAPTLVSEKLSTADARTCPPAVDELPSESSSGSPSGWWIGTVVPKRHAKRAVTRNLLKRQMRAAMDKHAVLLPAGLWVLRLKAPFDRKQFKSPASDPLRCCASDELAVLLQRAVLGRDPGRATGRERDRQPGQSPTHPAAR